MGNKLVEAVAKVTSSSKEIMPDVLVLQFTVVNACIVGSPKCNSGKWILIDTGLKNSSEFILQCTEKRFGKGSCPQAIILTHGHFDHVGSVIELAKLWDVPVYIHPLEMPYVTGKKDYPVADDTVDKGIIAKMSSGFPHKSINLGHHAVELPSDGRIPDMPDWRWIHTPGHTEGHISLFRETDHMLIVGDAFSTVKQESLMDVLKQKEQISGPPKYLTTDWQAAEDSVRLLTQLKPLFAIPGHGQPMKGEALEQHLELLTRDFKEIAKPKQGRFVNKQ